MKKLLPFLLLCISAVPLKAAPVQMWFEQANRFYSDQQYDSASVYYEKILESGVNNSTVLYNLGNTYFRQKKLGMARLYYERAARLNPEDPDILSNIKFVNSNLVDKMPQQERGFLENMMWRLHVMLSLKTQIWISLAVLVTISLFISICFYVAGNARLWFIYLSVLLGIFFSGNGISMGIKIYDLEKTSPAILLSPSSDARNEPDGRKILFTMHEGTKLRIRKTDGKWSLVSLPNGTSGWIENKDMGRI